MAQLKSGKTYIVENIGVKNYIDLNGSGHTVAEYFAWLSEKIAAGLDIEVQPIIKENNKCFLPLPYINKPTKNRLCLYIGGESLNNIVPKIGYFNEQDYYIENADELPRIMYNNQNSFIVINNGAYSKEVTAKNFLDENTSGTFVIDTNFLDAYGFYNIAFLANASCDSSQNEHITEVYASPRVFICDMFNVLTEQHYDGAFTLANPNTNSSLYAGGYVSNNSSSYSQLGYPSIAAIGVDKDGKYCMQGFLPQVFTSDYDNTIISASMIRIQFGKLKTYYPMYITLGNAIENLINYCDSTNVRRNKTWYKDAFEIDNKKFTISCSCDKTTFSSDNPQWAVVIKDKIKDEKEELPALKFCSDGDFSLSVKKPNWNGTIEYSEDECETWVIWHGEVLSGNASKSIYLRGSDNTRITGRDQQRWLYTGKSINGNIEYLLDYKKVQENKHPIMDPYCYFNMFNACISLVEAPKLPATTLAKYCYNNMFAHCASLKKAPELPATTLANYCYQFMFSGCTSLTEAPELPATTLAKYCYESMFSGCTSLKKAPKLPAITLAGGCYSAMFYNCFSLTEAPELPATTLAKYCYNNMFFDCNSLTEVPKLLPATTLAYYCYSQMFYNCTSLTEAPELPATTLADFCYSGMFYNCTSLTEAPELPANILTSRCYESMFEHCTSLTEVPELPATTLANCCYEKMFGGCSLLKETPKLPATTLAEYCYQFMFQSCSSLIEAPELPATTLTEYCYFGMFQSCSSLQNLPKLSATTLAKYCYSYMFEKCNIILKEEETEEYKYYYRIPYNGEGVGTETALKNMFDKEIQINKTYYVKYEPV